MVLSLPSREYCMESESLHGNECGLVESAWWGVLECLSIWSWWYCCKTGECMVLRAKSWECMVRGPWMSKHWVWWWFCQTIRVYGVEFLKPWVCGDVLSKVAECAMLSLLELRSMFYAWKFLAIAKYAWWVCLSLEEMNHAWKFVLAMHERFLLLPWACMKVVESSCFSFLYFECAW